MDKHMIDMTPEVELEQHMADVGLTFVVGLSCAFVFVMIAGMMVGKFLLAGCAA